MTNKNIWLLLTHEESIIHHDHTGFFLSENFQNSKSINSSVTGINAYITKEDEDINENDFIITKDGRLLQVTYLLSKELQGASKVVLSTDKSIIRNSSIFLIKQEFLKWFVEKANDSGKPIDIVEVKKTTLAYDEQGRKIDFAIEKGDYTVGFYEPIIPSNDSVLSPEEPTPNLVKQHEPSPTKPLDDMTTDEMLVEIVSYGYRSAGFPYVFLDYSHTFGNWSVTWRNPMCFSNNKQTDAKTPHEACKKALQFIKDNPKLFTRL